MIARMLLCCVAICSSALAGTYSRKDAGSIRGARLSWVSATTIKLSVGYGEIGGEYWELKPTDTYVTTGFALTGLSATPSGVVQYVYVDGANSLLPLVTLKNSPVAPAWSDSNMGWYNGQDRCIGAVWVEPTGALRNFYCPDDETYVWNSYTQIFPGSIPTTSNVYTVYDFSSQVPVNVSWVAGFVSAYAEAVPWKSCRVGLFSEKSWIGMMNDGVQGANANAWLPYERGMAKKLKWTAQAFDTSGAFTSTGTLYLALKGYKLER